MHRSLRSIPGHAQARGTPCGSRDALLRALEARSVGDAAVPTLLLVADIDGFRRYNARHGYAAGDEVLDEIGGRLARAGDAYRLGGDTFALVAAAAPLELAKRLSLAIDALTIHRSEVLQCSFGAVVLPIEQARHDALALAEERLEDQRRRRPAFADRVAEVLLALVHSHHPDLRTHSDEVARLAAAVADRLGLSVAERALVRRTATLHDVGKLSIGMDILEKAGPLHDDEWVQIRGHTADGERLLQPFPSLESVAPLVRATHERYGGAGYPDGTTGEEIPLVARVVTAVDAYHAMISDRPYAAALSPEEARAELEACTGSQFDPAVVAAIVAELADRGLTIAEAIGHGSESGSLHGLARLHALLDSASRVDDPDELPGALDAVARVVGETLGYGAVVINLYRHEWDDFVVSTVHGDDPVLKDLLGSTYGWDMWDRLLQPQFRCGGAYTIYAGQYDWSSEGGHRVVPDVPTDGDPDAWQGEDEIFVPFRHADGHILGIFNVALPRSGKRPSEEELHVLTTVVQHAARAVQRAQGAAAAAAHRTALERLLRVSSRLTDTGSGTSVLEAICAGISEALGFQRVCVHLHDTETGSLLPAAAVGVAVDDPGIQLPFGLDGLQRIFAPEFEIEGCYLVPFEHAWKHLGPLQGLAGSTWNGRGPWAWQRHWLVVPLHDQNRDCLGIVLADDPVDRLIPSKECLQALRLFANQATVALESVAQYEAQRYLAEHDALTRLRNRHCFIRELEAAVEQCRASGERLALVYCDLDGFKHLNDVGGHAAGDRALQRFAAVLSQTTRQADCVFRIGGDEFALLLRGCGRDEARAIVERAMAAWTEAPGELPAAGLSASFGVAVLERGVELTAEELLRLADEAMYDAKRSQSLLKIAA
jgi:diguanylate cyclase (GGDEF)-like protein